MFNVLKIYLHDNYLHLKKKKNNNNYYKTLTLTSINKIILSQLILMVIQRMKCK